MRNPEAREHSIGQRANRRALAEINDLIEDGVYDAASVLAWEVQRTAPGDPTVWLLLADIDFLRRRFAAAMYAARMATRLDPSSAEAWLLLARTAVTRPRWRTEGLDAALQATALAPAEADTWTVLAELQLARDARYEAAVAAERAIKVAPDHPVAHRVLGDIALAAGEWSHAEAAYRRVLDLDAADADARAGLTEALEAQDIDPSDQLARYGDTSQSGTGVAGRVWELARHRIDIPALEAQGVPSRQTLAGIAACVVAGVLLGVLVPGLGLVRGLVAATALLLMWYAVRPTRRVGSRTDDTPAPTRVLEPASIGAPAPPAPESLDTRVDPLPTPEVSPPTDETPPPPTEDATAPVARDATAPVDDTTPVEAATPPVQDATPPVEDTTADAEADGITDPAARPVAEEEAAEEPAPDAMESASEATSVPDAPPVPTPDAIGIDMPDDPDELAELSREGLAASDIELAHAAASRLEAVAPQWVEAHRALAAVAMAEQDYDQARQHYLKVLELEPLDQDAHERLALVTDSLQRTRSRSPLRRFRGHR